MGLKASSLGCFKLEMLPGVNGVVPLCAGADPPFTWDAPTCHSSTYAGVTYLAAPQRRA